MFLRTTATILFFATLGASNASARIWTDTSGSFRVDAQLVVLENDQVRLRKPDGSIVDVPLSRLSEADRQFVRQRTDRYGVLLPAGAIARLGDTRWRHSNRVDHMLFMPDGRSLAVAAKTGSYDKEDVSVRMIDARSGTTLRRFQDSEKNVSAMAVSESGRYLAVARPILQDGEGLHFRVWDLETGKCLWRKVWDIATAEQLYGKDAASANDSWSAPNFLRFGPNDEKLIVSDLYTAVRTFDAMTGEETSEFIVRRVSPQIPNRYFTLTHDGRFLVTAPDEKTYRLQDVMNPKIVKDYPMSVPDVVLGYQRYRFIPELRDLRTGKVRSAYARAREPDNAIRTCRVGPDGRTAVLSLMNRALSVDLELGMPLADLTEKRSGGRFLAFSPDGRLGAILHVRFVWGSPRDLRIVDLRTGVIRAQCTSPRFSTSMPAVACFSPDGKRLAIVLDKHVVVWDFADGKPLPEPVDGHSQGVSRIALSPDGQFAATSSNDLADGADGYDYGGTVRLWKVDTGEEIHRWLTKRWLSKSLVFSPDGHLLAIDNRETIDLMQLSDRSLLRSLRKEPPGVKQSESLGSGQLAFAQDGKQMHCWHNRQRLMKTWDVETGELLQTVTAGIPDTDTPGTVASGLSKFSGVAFAPRQGVFTSNQFGGKVHYLLDLKTGNVRRKLEDTRRFTTVCFSQDRQMLALGLQTGEIMVIDAQTAKASQEWRGPNFKEFEEFRGPRRDSQPQAFLDDNRVLVTDESAKGSYFWDVATGKEIGHIDTHRIRAVSADGRYVASVDGTGTALIWDVDQLLQTFENGPAR